MQRIEEKESKKVINVGEIRKILDQYKTNGMSYDELTALLKLINEVGYTFDFGFDSKPYGLRKIGTNLKDLIGFEDIK